MNIILKSALYFSLLLIISSFPISVVSAEVIPYKVTDGFHAIYTGVPGRVTQSFNLPIIYDEGKMILSRNPDGTGEVNIGDTLHLQNVPSIGKSYFFNQFPDCITFPKMPPVEVSEYISRGFSNVRIRYILNCPGNKNIGALYLVNIIQEVIPAEPDPFLRLPFNYSGSFEYNALNPNSWFDHQYPLQNIPCCQFNVLPYSGVETVAAYRSHNGYDYGLRHGIKLNSPVLAAASGWATYMPENETGGLGHTIKIDHENGYQTGMVTWTMKSWLLITR